MTFVWHVTCDCDIKDEPDLCSSESTRITMPNTVKHEISPKWFFRCSVEKRVSKNSGKILKSLNKSWHQTHTKIMMSNISKHWQRYDKRMESLLQSWYRLLCYANLIHWTGLVIFFPLFNLTMPLLSHLVLLIFVLLILLLCYIYDAILILTLGYPLFTKWYIPQHPQVYKPSCICSQTLISTW